MLRRLAYILTLLLCVLGPTLSGCMKVYEEDGETKIRPGTIEIEDTDDGG